jgi:hypothetical protein
LLNFREKVADEEDAGAKPEYRVAHAKRVLHRQLGEAHIHAIKVGAEVPQHQHRHQPPRDLPYGRMLQRLDLYRHC